MKPEGINTILNKTQSNFVKSFVNSLENSDLKHLLKFCFPKFNVNTRKKQYFFLVEICFESEAENSTDTNDSLIVINDSYGGTTIFKAHSEFIDSKNIIVDLFIDKAKIDKNINREKLVLNQIWKNDFHEK